MSTDMQFDVDTESKDVETRLTASIGDLYAAISSHVNRGEVLKNAAIEKLATCGPDDDQTTQIEHVARQLSGEIRQFSETFKKNQLPYINSLGVPSEMAALRLAGAIEALRVKSNIAVQAVVEDPEAAADQNALLKLRLLVVARKLVMATQIAADLWRLWEAELQSSLGKMTPDEAQPVIESIKDRLNTEASAAVVPMTAERLFREQAPIAAPVLDDVVRITLDLHEKIHSIQPWYRYAYGNVDEMVNFGVHMRAERLALEDVIKLFDDTFRLRATHLDNTD